MTTRIFSKSYFHYLWQAVRGKISDLPPAMPVLPNGLVVITLTSSLPGVGKTVTAGGLKTLLEREGSKVFVSRPSFIRGVDIMQDANIYAGIMMNDRVDLLMNKYHYLIRDVDAG